MILDVFTHTINSPMSSTDQKTKEKIHRGHRQNFFEIVPESNKCTDVGVPEELCACFPIQEVDLKNEILIQAASASIMKINKDLISSDKCRSFQLGQITSGAVLNKTSSDVGQKLRYVVGFTTSPGQYLFEAEINYFPVNKTFSREVEVKRVSKIKQAHVKCIQDAKLELFCYCN